MEGMELWKERIVIGLRWAAILPGALLAGIGATFVSHFFAMQFAENSDGSMRDGAIIALSRSGVEVVERLGYAFLVPLAIVYFGAMIAPAYQVRAAIVLMALYIASLGLMFGYVLGTGGILVPSAVSVDWGLNTYAVPVLGSLGAILGLYLTYKRQPSWMDG